MTPEREAEIAAKCEAIEKAYRAMGQGAVVEAWKARVTEAARIEAQWAPLVEVDR